MKQILTPNQIRDGVRQLADELTAIYGGRPVTIVAILTGSLVLLADLIRQLGYEPVWKDWDAALTA